MDNNEPKEFNEEIEFGGKSYKMIFNFSDKVFFGQKNINEKWHLPQYASMSLGLNDFDITWSHTPPDGLSVPERLNACDEQKPGSDLFFNINEYSKYNYRFENNYHTLDRVPVDIIRKFGKDRKVKYEYNLDWFRSQNFKKEHDGLHIVFHGCSNTEGIGANIENTWSHMLYKDLEKNHKIDGYYNLARSGSGWHKIIHNFIVYVERYGAPDFLFILHPNILRNYIWNLEGKGWRYEQYNPWGEEEFFADNLKMHREQFPSWAISWKLFIKYCNEIGTKVLWSTWDTWEIENIKNTPYFYDTFFPIYPINNDIVKKEYMDLIEREDAVWARDGHDGYVQQYHWYKMFKEEIDRRGWLK